MTWGRFDGARSSGPTGGDFRPRVRRYHVDDRPYEARIVGDQLDRLISRSHPGHAHAVGEVLTSPVAQGVIQAGALAVAAVDRERVGRAPTLSAVRHERGAYARGRARSARRPPTR